MSKSKSERYRSIVNKKNRRKTRKEKKSRKSKIILSKDKPVLQPLSSKSNVFSRAAWRDNANNSQKVSNVLGKKTTKQGFDKSAWQQHPE